MSSPAILATTWALVVGISVSRGLTLQVLWVPFWSTVSVSTIVGIYIVIRDRSVGLFITPVAASLILMAPYVVHGFASFPGSWFWDGFAYVAGGESLWQFHAAATSIAKAFFFPIRTPYSARPVHIGGFDRNA